MSTIISIKDFRQSLASVADAVMKKGETFTVMRRSRPAFVVKPFEDDEDIKWKTLIDFTEGGKKEGMPAGELYEAMKQFEEKDGEMDQDLK